MFLPRNLECKEWSLNKLLAWCQIKIHASLSSRYENNHIQIRLAYNDFLYDANKGEQNIRANQCSIIFIVCKDQIMGVANNLLHHADDQIMGISNNEFKYYPNNQIMYIANKDWLIKTSCPK